MSQQNMFLEGLHQVYMQPLAAPRPPAQSSSSQVELDNVRIQRWFGAVVNTRLLLSGVVQVLSAVACILTTVIYTCVSYNCAVSMATPVWPSLLYVASGVYAMEVQRRANKVKIIALVAANIFSLVFGFSAMMSTSLKSPDASALNPKQVKPFEIRYTYTALLSPLCPLQLVGSYVAKGSSITFTVQCLLASLYVLFLCWRGLYRYSPPPAQAYSRVTQEAEDTTLLENMEYDL
uniref:Si:dkey-30c15.13 n=1 Tax=Neogobius melanostomus TaxID=47308 RepID=A0A8C6UQC2_9GOBI